MKQKASSPKEIRHYYATVSQAISELASDGYTVDLNLEENCIVRPSEESQTDEFEIVKIYRYEGDSDPADEATVYGIQSAGGMKGLLVTGDGIYADNTSTALLSRLTRTRE